jgi:glycine/D-amino acid oxidase-like deaminating enzyme
VAIVAETEAGRLGSRAGPREPTAPISDPVRETGSPALTRHPVVVIGGGIAGLASAWQLAEHGVPDVVLVEAEPLLGMHATARNAAIFLPLEDSRNAIWLATRSRELLDGRLGTSWLSAQGIALVSGYPEPLDELRYAARKHGVFHERWNALQLESRVPLLTAGDVHHALFLPLGGVMDVNTVTRGIERWARAGGVRIRTSTRVASIEVDAGQVRGVLLEDGGRIETARVVLAAGAWTQQLARMAGAPLELTPLRRHLVLLGGPRMPKWKSPVVWRIDDSPAYFRPESGLTLASPCDETPWEPGIPATDPVELERLAQKLQDLAPGLADAEVRRVWACLRTMTEDGELAVGVDPRVRGLYWIAGLGGRGMTCGAAAGEMLARVMLGLSHPLSRNLAPARLI